MLWMQPSLSPLERLTRFFQFLLFLVSLFNVLSMGYFICQFILVLLLHAFSPIKSSVIIGCYLFVIIYVAPDESGWS